MLADPRVVLLDEATSSLDGVDHRAPAVHVMIANRVLVLTDGRVVQDGSPAELIEGTGEFADLHAAWLASLA